MSTTSLKERIELLPFSTRLEEMYALLSDREKRELTRYLSSSYFVRDKNLVLLHNFMSTQAFPEVRYDKKAAWKFVFARVPFNEKKFRYLVSDLLAATEEFIYLQHVLSAKPGYYQQLHKYYAQRDATENSSALATKIQSTAKLANQVVYPATFLEKHFENELVEELHTTSLKTYRSHVQKRKADEPTGLDHYYIIEKLRHMCRLANDNNVFGLNTHAFNEPEVLKTAEQKLSTNFFVSAYLHVFELLQQGKEESYFGLKKLLQTYAYEIDETSMAELMTYARNFCIAKINAGQSKFFEELFELYKQGLNNGSLLPNGELNERNYKNIVTTALRSENNEWALDFIETYRYKLNKVVRDNAYNYNTANYYFHTGKYDKVLRNLQKVQLADLFYGLDARSLMIKCYYELDEKEAFMNTYYSFRVFIQRRKNVSKQHQLFYQNLLRFAKKLMNIRPNDKKSIEKLSKEIQLSKAVADKHWLEEKLRVFL